MTTDLMTSQHIPSAPSESPSGPAPRKDLEPSLRDILSKARVNRPGALGAWKCGALTAAMMWAAFTPLNWGWLGWFALVPVCLLIRIETRTEWMYRAILLTAAAQTIVTLQWMRLGDPAMVPGWWALGFYWAAYLVLFVALARVAVHRFRIPLAIAVPVLWVGLEFVRGTAMTGFSWYFLGHTQYRWLEIIQISDLTGAYGVSFLLALSAATIAGLVPHAFFLRWKLVLETRFERGQIDTPKRPGLTAAVLAALVLVSLAYGYVRRGQADFVAGPRIALIQSDFESSLKHDPTEATRIFHTQNNLTGEAILHHPDLIVWPETMFRWPITKIEPGVTDPQLVALAPPGARIDPTDWLRFWHDREPQRVLTEMSQKAQAGLVIGIDTHVAHADRTERFNSAVFFDPERGFSGQYDKRHRVVFGEYIPLQKELPFLHKLTPFAADFGIAAGSVPARFQLRNWTFSPVICFEDTVPGVMRDAARPDAEGRPVDCLVNLTNDGWFRGSSELDQHLITSLFRCVETRTPMVRSVNTGISAFIDGDGAILEPEVFLHGETGEPLKMIDPATGAWTRSVNALLVHEVPLDPRGSLYLQAGDVFAGSCGGLTILLLLAGIFTRRRPADVTPEETAS
jgi:apolipoprotein N-acyltransferase